MKRGALWTVGALLLMGCGSGSETRRSSAAPDTGGAGGADGTAAQCASGDTRACVGVGACEGGQACDDAGRWGACQCAGESGGAGGQGPAATGGAAPTCTGTPLPCAERQTCNAGCIIDDSCVGTPVPCYALEADVCERSAGCVVL